MNRFSLVLLIITISSCQQQEQQKQAVITKEDIPLQNTKPKEAENNALGFHKTNARAVLLGDNIQLLDYNLKVIKDITHLNGHMVEVKEVSDKYQKENQNDDYCLEFKYVKIKAGDIEGYVDGRKVFELIKSTQNKNVTFGQRQLSITTTSNFGIGVSNEVGLTGCSVFTPAVINDPASQYEGLVRMIRNDLYQDGHPWFQLRSDDGAGDEIVNIELKDGKFLFKIRRTFQEGGADLLVAIYKDGSNDYVAEILENKHTTD